MKRKLIAVWLAAACLAGCSASSSGSETPVSAEETPEVTEDSSTEEQEDTVSDIEVTEIEDFEYQSQLFNNTLLVAFENTEDTAIAVTVNASFYDENKEIIGEESVTFLPCTAAGEVGILVIKCTDEESNVCEFDTCDYTVSATTSMYTPVETTYVLNAEDDETLQVAGTYDADVSV